MKLFKIAQLEMLNDFIRLTYNMAKKALFRSI
jgi:hypothetical protein